jgi:glycerol-3-phosphate dehydrogenase (NAD(P)+)
MAIIAVVGAGVMGTALTFPAADNGHEIRLVGTHLDDAIIASCRGTRFHPRLKRTIPDRVQPFFHSELMHALEGVDLIVLGVNSRGVHWAADSIGPGLRPGQAILMVTKGLESSADGDLMILPDVVASRLPEAIRDKVHYAAIGGPSIAGELAARHQTSVVFVSRDESILLWLRSLFAAPYYHIWTATDIVGLEVCVALKNPYALAVGLVTGLLEKLDEHSGPQMHNAAAAIFAQGLAETAYLVQALGGGLETVFSLPGAGDLYVTTQGGRNSRMGRLLGLGLSYSDAVEEMEGETIEGIDAVLAVMPAIEDMAADGKIDIEAFPLLRSLHHIIARNAPVEFEFERFFSKLPLSPPDTALSVRLK